MKANTASRTAQYMALYRAMETLRSRSRQLFSVLKDLTAIEEKWTFGFIPWELPAWLKPFGWELRADTGAAEYRQRYAFHSLSPIPADATSFNRKG